MALYFAGDIGAKHRERIETALGEHSLGAVWAASESSIFGLARSGVVYCERGVQPYGNGGRTMRFDELSRWSIRKDPVWETYQLIFEFDSGEHWSNHVPRAAVERMVKELTSRISASGGLVEASDELSRAIQAELIVTTTPSVEGRRVVNYLGLVCGEGFLRNYSVGSREDATPTTLSAAREEAVHELVDSARTLRADAIIGIQFTVGRITESTSIVHATGTAVALAPAGDGPFR